MLALAVGLATSGTACGSSVAASSKLQQSCTAVSDVLSDGPDPGADSVGYAEAQVLPLRQLEISDPTLDNAVRHLAAAYQAFSSTNGTARTAASVDAAQRAVDAICPGAAQ